MEYLSKIFHWIVENIPPFMTTIPLFGGFATQFSAGDPVNATDVLFPPIGSIVLYSSATGPGLGWLLCDGSAVSRTTYATLFALVSTTYGAGDGSTTFNLPNLKGKVPVGYNASETEFDAMGETGGAKTHTLTESEMPAHTHTVPFTTGGSGSGAPSTEAAVATPTNPSTGSTGGGGAHNNLQPYITLQYLIRGL